MSYLNHAYNPSPTIAGIAAADIEAASAIALAFDESGKLKLPAEGDTLIGITLANIDSVKADEPIDVQVKDGCLWTCGGEVKRGNLLTADTSGKAVKAESGASLAVALEDGKADQPIQVYIMRTGGGANP